MIEESRRRMYLPFYDAATRPSLCVKCVANAEIINGMRVYVCEASNAEKSEIKASACR